MVRRIGFAPRTAVTLVKPLLVVLTKRDWSGMKNIPQSGGVIIAANHMSEFDPFVVAHYVYDAGRWPQFLAKSSLFKIPVLGPVVKAVRQIPVYRGTIDASKALDAAIAAIGRGEAVIIYPEGTTPKSGELWPGKGKTGIARLWLETGVPVVPVATWGAQQVFDPRTRKLRLQAADRRSRSAPAAPIDLSKFDGAAADRSQPVRDHHRDHAGAADHGRRDPRRGAAAAGRGQHDPAPPTAVAATEADAQ